jgi:hypothetical protein
VYRKENKKSNGSWVFWLTGLFVILAIFVFTVAIIRIQDKKSDISFEENKGVRSQHLT